MSGLVFNLRWVIRGHGKRAVVIIAREFDFDDNYSNGLAPAVTEAMCQEVARLATRQGWKKVYLMRKHERLEFIFTNSSGLSNRDSHKVFHVEVDVEQPQSSHDEDEAIDRIW